ncbi:MAG TPA: type II toxin-antitoxin system VapC family toxin [Caulobacteraceae bacterium]
MFVLDASVALACLLGQSQAELADAVIARIGDENAIVPAHFSLEIAGLVARQVAAGILAERDAIALAREAALWPVTVDGETSVNALNRTLALALAHRLSAFDAAYLEICLRRAAPLATFDKRLAVIARVHAIGLLIPLEG